MKVRIGTRGSELALWQARHVSNLLAACGVESELVVLKTRGDLIDNVPLQQVEGKAFFTAEIENALLEGRVDLAVHSHKDLPTESTPGLVIGAAPQRGPQGERLLFTRAAHDPQAAFLPLARGSRVGTSAPRRSEQLATLRPDLQVLDLRGNVPTRVRRLQEGRYDAIVLACAGLDRLELDIGELLAFDLPPELLTPAPAQGALALQVREADQGLLELCRTRLHHLPTAQAVEAERSLLVTSGGGCNLPLAAAVSVNPRADRRPRQNPPPHSGGTIGARSGRALDVQDPREAATAAELAPDTFVAHAFLGAGHPASLEPRARFPRWAIGRGATPAAAISDARAQLDTGAATGCGPLGGLRVALAGSASDGSVLGERLESLGARVTLERLIELAPIPGVDLAGPLAALRAGDALVVTSRQAARMLTGAHLRAGVTLAAVGRATARALEDVGLRAEVVGDGGAEALAGALTLPPGATVLWPCAEEALDDLSAALAARGVSVRRLAVYRTTKLDAPQLARDVDARVYMSPSAVEAALGWERANPALPTERFALGHATQRALEAAQLAALAPACDSGPITEALVAHLWRRFGAKESAR